jgi:hypothetical protein
MVRKESTTFNMEIQMTEPLVAEPVDSMLVPSRTFLSRAGVLIVSAGLGLVAWLAYLS